MLPGVAFILYLAIGCILIIMFLLLCVRISVFIEDTCPIRFCLRRKQRKLRKLLIRDMLFPNADPESPRPAPPSDENITADIICQPYIYRDAYSTGLTQLSGLSLLANLPLTVALSDGNPSDAIVTNCNSEHVRLLRNYDRQQRQRQRGSSDSEHTNEVLAEVTNEAPLNAESSTNTTSNAEDADLFGVTNEADSTGEGASTLPTYQDSAADASLHSLPPDYSALSLSVDNANLFDITSDATEVSSSPPDYNNATNRVGYESNGNDVPPPSYYECVQFPANETNGNFETSQV